MILKSVKLNMAQLETIPGGKINNFFILFSSLNLQLNQIFYFALIISRPLFRVNLFIIS